MIRHLTIWATLLVVLFLCINVASGEESDCMSCHSSSADASRFKHIQLIDPKKLAAGVHADLACTKCHVGDGPDAFKTVPHRYDTARNLPKCVDCHSKDFPDLIAEHARSAHATKLDTWHCGRCHDAHEMPKGQTSLPRAERNAWANSSCLGCHRESVYRVVGADPSKLAHTWLPAIEKHAKMRCVVCHTPPGEENEHNILPAKQATRDCAACHAEDTELLRKYVPRDGRSSQMTNPAILDEAYMPGAVRNRALDSFILWIALLSLAAIALHAGLRIVTGRNRVQTPSQVTKEYLYTVPVRIWHWSNAALFVLLALTGLRMHFSEALGSVMSFEAAYDVHCIAGVALLAVVLFFFVHNAKTGNGRQYLKGHPDGLKGVLIQARWYLIGIFKGEPHPYHASKERRFNPMQRLAYLVVMYLLYPVLVLTGLILLFPDLIPDRLFDRPGSFWIASAHYLLGAASVLFLILHLYLTTTGDRLGSLMAGMITGWHRSTAGDESEPEQSEEDGQRGE